MPSQGSPGAKLEQATPNRGDEFISSVSQTLDEEAELYLRPMATNQGVYEGNMVFRASQQAAGCKLVHNINKEDLGF